MIITLQRFHDTGKTTFGALFTAPDKITPPLKPTPQFRCFILEDTYRAVKVKGQTRIRAGVYQLRLKGIGESRFDASYTRKFKWHKGMIEVTNVPNFAGILFHPGNDHTDTEGCLIPGLICDIPGERVLSSTLAYEPLYMRITDALLAGTAVTLKIKDEQEL
jgi:hypothetical protein